MSLSFKIDEPSAAALQNLFLVEGTTFFRLTHLQGGRSCAGARVAPAEKFGLGRKF